MAAGARADVEAEGPAAEGAQGHRRAAVVDIGVGRVAGEYAGQAQHAHLRAVGLAAAGDAEAYRLGRDGQGPVGRHAAGQGVVGRVRAGEGVDGLGVGSGGGARGQGDRRGPGPHLHHAGHVVGPHHPGQAGGPRRRQGPVGRGGVGHREAQRLGRHRQGRGRVAAGGDAVVGRVRPAQRAQGDHIGPHLGGGRQGSGDPALGHGERADRHRVRTHQGGVDGADGRGQGPVGRGGVQDRVVQRLLADGQGRADGPAEVQRIVAGVGSRQAGQGEGAAAHGHRVGEGVGPARSGQGRRSAARQRCHRRHRVAVDDPRQAHHVGRRAVHVAAGAHRGGQHLGRDAQGVDARAQVDEITPYP